MVLDRQRLHCNSLNLLNGGGTVLILHAHTTDSTNRLIIRHTVLRAQTENVAPHLNFSDLSAERLLPMPFYCCRQWFSHRNFGIIYGKGFKRRNKKAHWNLSNSIHVCGSGNFDQASCWASHESFVRGIFFDNFGVNLENSLKIFNQKWLSWVILNLAPSLRESSLCHFPPPKISQSSSSFDVD